MKTEPSDRPFTLGEWRVTPATGRIAGAQGERELEPKVMGLLCLLAERNGEVVTREDMADRLWPGVTVNDDALARTVWKLRQALGDDAKSPRYVETLSKRGYRLLVVPEFDAEASGASWLTQALPYAAIAGVAAIVLFAASFIFGGEPSPSDDTATLVQRADAFYYEFEPASNDAAQQLYLRALEIDPDSAPANAGYANTLTQDVVRYAPDAANLSGSRIAAALELDLANDPDARATLERAEDFARAAIAADPEFPLGYRALGLSLSAQGDLEGAIAAYNRALTLDPDAWEALINLSDLHRIRGEDELSLRYMEQGYEAMTRVYDEQTVLIRPWYSETGLNIARAHREAGRPGEAERWYRRVLYWDPVQPDALAELADLTGEGG
ncbi:MAG: tetratricopeptide repeat protein [Alphaproteobacteria bacterium]|nr:tetratricopeptide repeat protein [Alphaproteobacteria bacterium]